MRLARFSLLVTVAFIAMMMTTAHARTRLRRTTAADEGLSIPDVRALAQDRAGFLWIGSVGGLTRYDGRQLTRWAPELLNDHVFPLAAGPEGEVVAAIFQKAVYRMTATGAEPLLGPDGDVLADVRALHFDRRGQLWVGRADGQLWMRTQSGAWSRPAPGSELERERALVVRDGTADDVYIGTVAGVWRVDDTGLARVAATRSAVVDMAAGPDDVIHVVTQDGVVARVTADGVETMYARKQRPVSLARRGAVLWVAYDAALVGLQRNRSPDVIEQGNGGPLLVDREGSLWMGTFHGLLQFPEPETRIWDDTDGLAKAHTRYVARTNGSLWFTAWNEPPHRIDLATDAMFAAAGPADSFHSQPCAAGDGRVWGVGERAITARDERAVTAYEQSRGLLGGAGCSTAADGSVWLGTGAGLFFVPRGGAPLFRGSLPGADDSWVAVPYEDANGILWASNAERVCSASAPAVRAGRDTPWRCQVVAGIGHANDMLETPAGDVWLATVRRGVLQWDGTRWRDVLGGRASSGLGIFALAASARGGVWVASTESVVRVRPGASTDESWHVLERISSWNGHVGAGAGDVLEDEDGTVWLATSAGIVQVPQSARTAARPAPSVALVAVRALGHAQDQVAPLVLPYGDNHLELGFSGPSFRDPTLLHFRMRLGAEGAWSPPTSQPVFHFVDLAPGRYQVQVAASLDDDTWSSSTAYTFTVLRPWYWRPWAWVCFGLAVMFALFGVHRARLAVSMRLERQRMRIAMDLHDEMGSGLGSIGLLAELATNPAVEGADARSAAGAIADTAGQLGGSLTDIVWSLRAGSGKLERLAAYLAERGAALFPGHVPEFDTVFPEQWPRTELSLPLRRSLQFIALEALHNAAKHAHAGRVVLGLRGTGKRWTLWIEDDGDGMGQVAKARPGGGLGLAGMQKRASEIGAVLSVESARSDGAGTRVSVAFSFGGRLPTARRQRGRRHALGRILTPSRWRGASK